MIHRAALAALVLGLVWGGGSLVAASEPVEVPIRSKDSLAHRGEFGFGTTDESREIVATMLEAMEESDPEQRPEQMKEAAAALRKYVAGKPYAGQYAPLAWFCEMMSLPEAQRAVHLKDPLTAAYYAYFTRDNAKWLKQYIVRKYQLRSPEEERMRTAQERQTEMAAALKEAVKEALKEAQKEGKDHEKVLEEAAQKALEKVREKRLEAASTAPGASAEQDIRRAMAETVLLEALLIHNFPGREQYENPAQVLAVADIQKGQKVADVGCELGYYTYRLCGIVGDQGLVYAVDVDEDRLDYVRDLAKQTGLANLRPILALKTDISLPEPVDVAFISSSYHDVYFSRTDQERRAFLTSLRQGLKPQGRLIIVENTPVANDHEIPWNTLAPELIVAQLRPWRFRLEKYQPVPPYRYVLVFRHEGGEMKAEDLKGPETGLKLERVEASPVTYTLKIDTDVSLLHFGFLDSFDVTPGGTQAARFILSFISSGMKRLGPLRQALAIYADIIPKENYGGEYTALQWFCEYFLADEAKRAQMLEDPMARSYFHFFTDDQCAVLRRYLAHKYRIRVPQAARSAQEQRDAMKLEAQAVGRIKTQGAFLEDLILFNNPRREEWEKTSVLLKLLPIKKGDKVADIGCGPGYYAHRFSQIVGPEGRVFAMDTKEEHIEFLTQFVKDSGQTNIIPILSTETDICVKEKIDVAFMCSLYHIIYMLASAEDRGAFMASIRNALKSKGPLIIIDNGPVKPGLLPYHGCHIAKELLIPQVEGYGFRLTRYEQIVPQRYLLIFEKTD